MSVDVLIVERDVDGDLLAQRIAEVVPTARITVARTRAEALAAAPTAEVVVALGQAVGDDLLAVAPRLRLVQALTTGTDAVTGLPSLRPDVAVCSSRGVQGGQVAELGVLLMLALLRRFPAQLRNQAAARWERWQQPMLEGRTVVIVGLGAIAEVVTARCRAFGMRVVGVSRTDRPVDGVDRVFPREGLRDAAALADVLLVLLPLDASTRGLIDADVLAALPPTAYLVNLSRGGVVDEDALLAALEGGRLAGAGLDVFATEPLPVDHPFWHRDDVIVTAHVGGMSDRLTAQVAPIAAENVRRLAAGERPLLNHVQGGSA